MITKSNIIGLNKKFDNGKVINEGSLNFAISNIKQTKDWIKQLAYLTRAILIDHVFEEGNKRTAVALIMAVIEMHNLPCDIYKVDKVAITIITKNVTNINQIRRMIKSVIQ
jgi:prophage maintenance system killer protein